MCISDWVHVFFGGSYVISTLEGNMQANVGGMLTFKHK